MTYRDRLSESAFLNATKQFPVLLLIGARQVGKTTFLKKIAEPNRRYVTLDDPLDRTLANDDPALFLQRYSPPVLIDEIQYAPGLFTHIKMRVDRDRKPGLFWLTGSQQFRLMQGVSETLAGRIAIIQMDGLSLREIDKRTDEIFPFIPDTHTHTDRFAASRPRSLNKLYEIIWRGSFPEIAVKPSLDWNLFYGSYVQTYLQRDVRELTNVGDERAFLIFLRSAAARSGQLLNVSELARDAGVTPATGKKWLSILEATGLVFLLEPYHANRIKRIVKAPKLYFMDTGLCAYIARWNSAEALEAGAMSGAILETWAVSEIVKSYHQAGRHAPIYYYRDKDKKEIDLLIEKDGMLHPIEIKKTASPKKDDVAHFKVLERLKMPIGAGALLCMVDRQTPLTPSIDCFPVSAI